tara:strand:- start:1156 stop:1647 length:492 start_codon:yes stop_codon:yes gene_type:complete
MESVYKCKYNREIIRSGCDILEIWGTSEKIVQDIVNRFNRQLVDSSGIDPVLSGLRWNENMNSRLIFNCSGKDKNGAGKIYLPPLSVRDDLLEDNEDDDNPYNGRDNDEESIKEEIKYDLILSEVVRKLKVIFDDCKIEQFHRKITDVYMNTAIHFLITIDWS